MKKFLASVAIVIGAASYWVFGDSPKYHQNEIRNPKAISLLMGSTKVFIGDTGKNTPQREDILKSLKKTCEESPNGFYLFLLGDYGYDDGVNNDKDYGEFIEPFLNLCEFHILTFGVPGNHEKYKIFPNGYMAKKFHGKGGVSEDGFVQENYYYLLTEESYSTLMADNQIHQQCFFLVDSSPWDRPFQSDFKDRIIAWIKGESKNCIEKNLLSHHYFFSSSKRKASSAWKRVYENVIVPLIFSRVISGHDHLIHYTVKDEIEHFISGMGAKTTKNPVGYLVATGNRYEFKILGNNFEFDDEEGEE